MTPEVAMGQGVDRGIEEVPMPLTFSNANDMFDEKSLQSAIDEAQVTMPDGTKIDIVELFSSLPPDQAEALLMSQALGTSDEVGAHAPFFIDMTVVPKHLRVRFLAMDLIASPSIGMRGYQFVQRTETTMKWAPNAKQMGNDPYIRAGNQVLCVMPMAKWLRMESARMQATITQRKIAIDPEVEKTISMLEKHGSSIEKQEARMFRHEFLKDEATLTKVADPDGPRDVLKAEEVEARSKTLPQFQDVRKTLPKRKDE